MLRYSIGVRIAAIGSLACQPQIVAKAIILAGVIGELFYYLIAAGKVAETSTLESAAKVLKELELTSQSFLLAPMIALTIILGGLTWGSCEWWYALLLDILLAAHILVTWWLLHGWRHVEGH